MIVQSAVTGFPSAPSTPARAATGVSPPLYSPPPAVDHDRPTMLHVEKELLTATTAKEVADLRKTELNYYLEHIGSVQTMATLLAGFAFTGFVSMDLAEVARLSSTSLYFMQMTGGLLGGASTENGTQFSVNFSPEAQQIGPIEGVEFFFVALEVFSVVACLSELLWVMTETLIARLLGSRLALRGPDGSIIRATYHLAKVLATSTRRFIWGLQWFIFSVVCHSLNSLHLLISVPVFFILLNWWRSQFKQIDRLADIFAIKHTVSTAFEDSSPEVSEMGVFGETSEGRGGVVRLHALRPKGWTGGFRHFFNPFASLHHLFDQVDDTQGDSKVVGKYHAPKCETSLLIQRFQAPGLAMERALQGVNGCANAAGGLASAALRKSRRSRADYTSTFRSSFTSRRSGRPVTRRDHRNQRWGGGGGAAASPRSSQVSSVADDSMRSMPDLSSTRDETSPSADLHSRPRVISFGMPPSSATPNRPRGGGGSPSHLGGHVTFLREGDYAPNLRASFEASPTRCDADLESGGGGEAYGAGAVPAAYRQGASELGSNGEPQNDRMSGDFLYKISGMMWPTLPSGAEAAAAARPTPQRANHM